MDGADLATRGRAQVDLARERHGEQAQVERAVAVLAGAPHADPRGDAVGAPHGAVRDQVGLVVRERLGVDRSEFGWHQDSRGDTRSPDAGAFSSRRADHDPRRSSRNSQVLRSRQGRRRRKVCDLRLSGLNLRLGRTGAPV